MGYLLSSSIRLHKTNDRMIIMDVRLGKFYTCNAAGALIIELLRECVDCDALLTRLAERLKSAAPPTLRVDMLSFLDTLVKNKLCSLESLPGRRL